MSFGPPRWYVTEATDHRPLCPPIEPESMWVGAGGPVVWDGEALWISVGDRVVAMSCSSEPTVICDPVHLLALCEGDALTVTFPAGLLDLRPLRPGHLHGVHTHASCTATGWGVPGMTLPMGATRSRRLRPWPLEPGVAWVDTGWLYSMDERGTRAMGAIGAHEVFFVGPRGAMLVGIVEEEAVLWHRCAAPGRPLRPLAEPVPSTDTRWSTDGERIAVFAATPEEQGALRIDLVRGTALDWARDWLPASADERWRPGEPAPRPF